MSGLISIAVTGINAAQAGLLTTSNNISNLNTEGYTRQRTIQASNPTVMTGAGGFGQGAHVVTVTRMYSEALTRQVLNAQSSVSALDTYNTQVSQIDNLLADTDSGLSPAIQGFFDGLQAVANNPSSISSRQSMVSAAESMVSTFQSVYSRLDEINDGVNAQIGTQVKSINSYAQQIASLNQKIVSSASLGGQPVNDLLDKRDQLVTDLNKLVKVQTTNNDDGSYNVFIGTGQQLVVGSRPSRLEGVASAADPTRIVVALVGESGRAQELPENLINGGELGGLLSFRSEALDTAFNHLGQIAASMATTYNAQNALGQDMLGNVAGSSSFVSNFFTLDQPVVIANSANSASSAPAPAVVTASLDGANYSGNVDSFQFAFDGTTYSMTRQSDGSVWTASDVVSLNSQLGAAGVRVGVQNSSYAAGDTFSVDTSVDGASFYSNLTDSDYELSFDGTNFTLRRLTDNASWTANTVANVAVVANQGFSLSDDSGGYTLGDSYVIQPTRDMARRFGVDAGVSADPRLVAAALPVVASASLANAGSGKVDGVSVAPGYTLGGLSASSGLTLTYSGGNLSGFPDGTVTVTYGGTSTSYSVVSGTPTIPYRSGATIKIDATATGSSPSGVSLTLSGVPADNDKFTILTNNKGVEDAGNVVLLGKLQTLNSMEGGTATYLDSYASFVNDIGNKASSAEIASEAQTTLLGQATAAREAVSGVNKDEEAAKLIEYQQAYMASAKILEISGTLFDAIMAIG